MVWRAFHHHVRLDRRVVCAAARLMAATNNGNRPATTIMKGAFLALPLISRARDGKKQRAGGHHDGHLQRESLDGGARFEA